MIGRNNQQSDDSLTALIAADIDQARRRYPDEAFAVELRRRLICRPAVMAASGQRLRWHLPASVAAALLLAIAVASFLIWRPSVAPPQQRLTLGEMLAALPRQGTEFKALPTLSRGGDISPFAQAMDLAMQTANSSSAVSQSQSSVLFQGRKSSGVDEMLRSKAVFHFFERYNRSPKEG